MTTCAGHCNASLAAFVRWFHAGRDTARPRAQKCTALSQRIPNGRRDLKRQYLQSSKDEGTIPISHAATRAAFRPINQWPPPKSP